MISELSRLGREQTETGKALGDIIANDVRVFLYLADKEVEYERAIDKFMVSAQLYADEDKRDKASQQVRDALTKKLTDMQRVADGYNLGGRAYGYDNVWVLPDGTEKKPQPGECKPFKGTRTIYRNNPTEAEVVVGIYKMYADEHGQKAIAYTLNGDPAQRDLLKRYFGAVRPRAPRGVGFWSPHTIHDILRNPRYRGVIPYGAVRKTYKGGTSRRVQGEEQFIDKPELRIVEESLWQGVQKRVASRCGRYVRSTGGKLHGRPQTGIASRYLLPGFVKCAGCESAMIVSSYGSGSGSGRRQVRCYVCSFRSNRGPTACSNAMRPLLTDLDGAVLTAIQRQALTPEVISAAARRAVELIRERTAKQPDRAKQLQREEAKLEAECGRLVEDIAQGKAPRLAAALAQREARIAAIQRELAETEAPAALDALSGKRLEKQFAERAARWRELLAGDVPLARQALRKLIAGEILFIHEEGGGYRLKGATRLGALLFDEIAAPEAEATRVKLASPRGFEPRLPP